MIKKSVFRALLNEGCPFVKILTFFIGCAGFTKSKIAEKAGVDPSLVTKTISGVRDSEKVRDVIICIIGFDPWKVKL